jgi:hypothetical protein
MYVRLPDDYDNTVENVEAHAYIIEDTHGGDLEHHFNGKEYCEEHIAILQNFGEFFRLNK